MPRVFPFEGLVYDPGVVGSLELVTAPPYDVISDERSHEYQRRSPYSVVHLDLAVALDDTSEPLDRYAGAGRLLRDWEAGGVLVRETEPRFHAYEMRFELGGLPRRILGVLCAMELEDWGGRVLPHERTMPGPIRDRLRLLQSTRTHVSPVYGTIGGPVGPLLEALGSVAETDPAAKVIDEQGVEHRMWRLPSDVPVSQWLADEPLMIADGHHRYTTALRYRDLRRRETDGPGPWDRVLTLVVDAGSQPVPVLPFHRIQLSGPVPAGGVDASGLSEILEALSDEDLIVGLVQRDGTGVTRRTLQLAGEPPAVLSLHREILDTLVAENGLRFTPDAAEADAAVRSGEAAAAWLLPPTTPDRIRKVVERGERLPQKSTYFWPKPRTGMVMMPLEPATRTQGPADRR